MLELALAKGAAREIPTDKSVPLAKDLELQLMFDLLRGVLLKEERLCLHQYAVGGKGGQAASSLTADVYVAAVSVAGGEDGAIPIGIGGAEVLARLSPLQMRIPDRGDV
jgi:hypothetical protein